MKWIYNNITSKLIYFFKYLIKMTYQKKIMIVDDDENIYEMYRLKFEKEWFTVLVCKNGLIALSKLTDFKPDLILLDIMMPEMNGFETLSAIKELTTTIDSKIIIFSNINNKNDIIKWMHIWADDYIVKADVTPKEIVKKVKTMLWIED